MTRKNFKFLKSAFLFFGISNASSVFAAGCDACLQARIESASINITKALTKLNKSATQAVEATEKVNNAIEKGRKAYISILETNQTQLLSSLDAATIKIEHSNTVGTETLSRLTDTLTETINTNAKNTLKLNEFFRHERMFGTDSHPLSGQIALNRSQALSAARREFDDRLQSEMVKFREWAYIVGKGDETKTIRLEKVKNKYEEHKNLLNLLATGLLTNQETNDLLTIMLLVVLPEPVDTESLSLDDRLKYNAFIERKAAAFKVMVKEVLNKAPLIDVDGWMFGYIQLQVNDGKTSFEEFTDAETKRKTLSPKWHHDIAKLTNIGLQREHVYQANMQNYLLGELIQTEQDRFIMQSLGQK